MNGSSPNARPRYAVPVLGAGLFVVGACFLTVASLHPTQSLPARAEAEDAPVPAVVLPTEAPAVLATTIETPAAPGPDARAALGEWIDGLAAELEHQPYQPRVFAERLESVLSAWSEELAAELERRLDEPASSDAQLVALASLGRALQLHLPAALASRLRPLALRDEGPFGISVEAARDLVAGGGLDELSSWCDALENARDARARSVACGALDALRGSAAERALVERALELGDARAAQRLLDTLGRALDLVEQPAQNPSRQDSTARLSDLAGDERADAGLRARALGVLRRLDPQSAQRLAADWFLDPSAGSERIEFAAGCLQGRAAALPALRAAEADARCEPLRRVRLAECVLFTPAAELDAQAGEDARGELRATLLDAQGGAARRRALHALARFGTDEDRAQVAQVAASDPDALARAAARSALQREASEWR